MTIDYWTPYARTTADTLRKIKTLDARKFEKLEKVTRTKHGRHNKRHRCTRTEALLKRLEQLPPANETVINELWKLDGIAGEVARCYYMDGADVKLICKWLEYSTRQVYRMINDSTESCFTVYLRRTREGTKLLCNGIASKARTHIHQGRTPGTPFTHFHCE